MAVTATKISTALEFEFRNDPNAFALDDISVQPAPAPMLQAVTQTNGMISLIWSAIPGLAYQVQYNDDVSSGTWNNLGGTVTAISGTLAVSVAVTTSPRRFFRIIMLP